MRVHTHAVRVLAVTAATAGLLFSGAGMAAACHNDGQFPDAPFAPPFPTPPGFDTNPVLTPN